MATSCLSAPSTHSEATPGRHYLYLDASNIWIGGAQVSAHRAGMAATPADAAKNRIVDPQFRLNFCALRDFGTGHLGAAGARAVCVGSKKTLDITNVERAAMLSGWDTDFRVRNAFGREKGVDTGLVVAALKDLMLAPVDGASRDVTLFSGDADYVPVIEALNGCGIAVDVVSWDHATAGTIRRAARRWIALDEYFDLIRLRA